MQHGQVSLALSAQARRQLEQLGDDRDLRRSVFDPLAAAAVGRDVAVYRLALGRFHAEDHRPDDAVDQYQAILADPRLSRERVRLASGVHQAGLEARARLKSLVEAHGPGIYAEYDALAAQRMTELTAGAPASAFVELAEQFPLASAAPAARAAAGESLMRQGRTSQAAVQLNLAYVRARDMKLLQSIVGQLAELHERAGRTGRARRWLSRARRDHGDLRPVRNGEPVSIDRWIDELADGLPHGGGDRLPVMKLPLGKPYVFPGRLLTPRAQPPGAPSRDTIVTAIGEVVQLRAGASLKVRWSAQVDGADVQLLSLTDEQVLLWSERAASLTALDAGSGQLVWRRAELFATVERAPGGLVPAPGALAPVAQSASPGVMVAVGEVVVCVADAAGSVVGLDRHSGDVLWQYDCGVASLTHVVVDEATVALAGATSQIGKVIVLDALTGGLEFPPLQEEVAVGWLGFADMGQLVYATASDVVAVDTADGDMLWRLPIQTKRLSGVGAAGAGHVLLHDASGSLMLIDADAGRLVHRIEVPGVRQRAGYGLQLRLTDRQWLLLTHRRAQAWRYDGRLLWRDAISASKSALLRQLTADDVVAIAAQVVRAAPVGVNARPNLRAAVRPSYRLFVLDRRGGAIRDECDLPTEGRPLDALAGVCLDHHFVLSTFDTTIVVPDAVAANGARGDASE